MAKRHSSRRHIDRHGAAPVVTISATCELGSHGRCRGAVVSLTAAPGARCECSCHRAELPDAFAAQVTLFPPCEGDAA